MTVVGIVGSPRKNGRTNELIDAALSGARLAGADVEKVYLIDYDIRSFTGSGGSREAFTFAPQELSDLCGEAEALIVGAPVYWGDINGMTKNFMDTVRTGNANGKPALGTAIAGGTGKGLISGVQSIYHFFFHRQMRAIDPTPVSRFNFARALKSLEGSGKKLVEMAKEPRPFPGETRDDRWPEVAAHYASLPHFRADPLDEFVMLARQLIEISEGDKVNEAQAELDQALNLMKDGDRGEAARHAVRAYQALYFAPS